MSDAAVLLTALQAELDVFTQRLGAGFDVAPARRARFEGMVAAVLALGTDRDELLESCRGHLPADARLMVENGQAPRLDIWQRRAPVEPTAVDI